MFRDEFENLNLWTILKGEWLIVKIGEENVLDGVSVGEGLITAGSLEWTDYVLSTRATIVSDSSNPEVAFIVRLKDSSNFYWLGLGCFGHRVGIGRMVDGAYAELASKGLSSEVELDRMYDLKISAVGDTLQLYVDGSLELEVKDSTHEAGAIGIRPYNSHIQVEYVEAAAPTLPIDLPTVAGITLVVVDAALIAYAAAVFFGIV